MRETTDAEVSEISEGGNQELAILVTDDDKYGTDITKMSNFFDVCIQQVSSELRTSNAFDIVKEIPIGDLAIINDVLHNAEVMINGKQQYIPDFDSLPGDIKSKLNNGIYKLGESKQVDGNLRPVILDDEGVRIKDITLKRFMNSSDAIETFRGIANQVQMKQISAKLDNIQELQSYQIDRDRDRDILVPFFDARDNILRAQNGGTSEEKAEYLGMAVEKLTTVINAVNTDISTTSNHLANCTKWPIFHLKKDYYIKNLTFLLQLANKYVGVLMLVFDYLGDSVNSRLVLEGYQHVMQEFITKSVDTKGHSAAQLLHLHYPYNKSNRNCWYQFTNDMKVALQASQKVIDVKEIYLVGVEDVYDEDEC